MQAEHQPLPAVVLLPARMPAGTAGRLPTPTMMKADRATALRARLVDALEVGGVLRSREWSRAFRAVPRHAFVTAFDTERRFGPPAHLEPEDEGWLEAVYADESLIIQRDEEGRNLSSSSAPTVIAMMLQLLDVEDGQRVLEIGTGSGYNAALLTERLSSDDVSTIDIDRQLVEQARRRLSEHGYRPRAEVGDAEVGLPQAGPFDRLICTCAVWPVPTSWLQQVRAGGRIVTPLMSTGAVALDVRGDGSASGRYDPGAWYFMGGRGKEETAWSEADAVESRSARRPARIIDAGGRERAFSVLVEAAVGRWFMQSVAGEPWVMVADRARSSWASVGVHSGEVTQSGPRRLWDEVEDLYDEWCRLGAPNRDRFGLTVDPGGSHTLWLDEPDSGPQWKVVPARTGK